MNLNHHYLKIQTKKESARGMVLVMWSCGWLRTTKNERLYYEDAHVALSWSCGWTRIWTMILQRKFRERWGMWVAGQVRNFGAVVVDWNSYTCPFLTNLTAQPPNHLKFSTMMFHTFVSHFHLLFNSKLLQYPHGLESWCPNLSHFSFQVLGCD